MKFKTKEDLLRNKEKNANSRDASCFSDSYSNGIEDAFMTFKERIEFYNRYRSKQYSFNDDYPDSYRIYTHEWWKIKKAIFPNKLENDEIFNVWLFQYCFGDIE